MPVVGRLCSFEGPPGGGDPAGQLQRRAGPRSRTISGGFGVGETPLPIPNRAVKPHSADGTWPSRAWESRSPPVLLRRPAHRAARLRSAATTRDRAATPAAIVTPPAAIGPVKKPHRG